MEQTNILQPLIDDAIEGRSRMESTALATTRLDPAGVEVATESIRRSPDHRSYLVLLALKSSSPEQYQSLSPTTRASVFCGALANLRFLNDFGYLDSSESYDGTSARALLATGDAAIPCLRSLLDDLREAPLMGSEEATMSSSYSYRRADFAYRYLSLLTGREPHFHASPQQRDVDIERLVEALDAQTP